MNNHPTPGLILGELYGDHMITLAVITWNIFFIRKLFSTSLQIPKQSSSRRILMTNPSFDVILLTALRFYSLDWTSSSSKKNKLILTRQILFTSEAFRRRNLVECVLRIFFERQFFSWMFMWVLEQRSINSSRSRSVGQERNSQKTITFCFDPQTNQLTNRLTLAIGNLKSRVCD